MSEEIPEKYLKYKKYWKYLETKGWTLFAKRQYAIMDDLIHCFKRIAKERSEKN